MWTTVTTVAPASAPLLAGGTAAQAITGNVTDDTEHAHVGSATDQGNADTVTLSGYGVQEGNSNRLLPDQHCRRHRGHPQECR